VTDSPEELVEVVQDTAELESEVEEVRESPARAPGAPRWVAPAWFFFGVVVGIVGFAVYNLLLARPAVTTSAGSPAAIDDSAMRSAARQGVIEAIATLQAGGQPQAAESQEPAVVDPSQFAIRPANALGNDQAAITVIEFSDFQCPFCGRFQATVAPTLLKQYVDTGKVKFVYKHSAFLGQESVWAAQASECAADQGKFWEYHDLLFSRQNGENQGAFNKDKLIGFANELGLDMAKFEPCLTNDETLARVQADTQEGQRAGVRGTPTFFINGQPLVGAQPLQAFQQVIDKTLGQ
jgi:protein-disulfide isomerase